MADERTMSRITRLNTPLRNQADVQTLINQVQVYTFQDNNPDHVTRPKARPMVGWRDVAKDFGVRHGRDITAAGSISAAQEDRADCNDFSSDDDISSGGLDDDGDAWTKPKRKARSDRRRSYWLDDTSDEDSESRPATAAAVLHGADVADLTHHVLRNLLSDKEVLPPREERSEAEAILPAAASGEVSFQFSLG